MTTTAATEADFIDAIVRAPDDDTVRLVYADWLCERADGILVPRAEFVRVQCELAKGPPGLTCSAITSVMDDQIDADLAPGQPVPKDGERVEIRCLALWPSNSPRWVVAAGTVSLRDSIGGIRLYRACKPAVWMRSAYDREKELLARHWCDWRGFGFGDRMYCTNLLVNASGENGAVTFRRGFVEAVNCSCEQWLSVGPAVVAAAPTVREVRLSNLRGPEQTGPPRGASETPSYVWGNDWSAFARELYYHANMGQTFPGDVMQRCLRLAEMLRRETDHTAFDSREDALRAVSRGALAWAKEESARRAGASDSPPRRRADTAYSSPMLRR